MTSEEISKIKQTIHILQELIKEDENSEEYKSLYDYLGKPAGKELSNQVYNVAKEQGIKIESQEISNKNYTGKVMIYPISFLIYYFEGGYKKDQEGDDLPF